MPNRSQLQSIQYNVQSLGLKPDIAEDFSERLRVFILEETENSYYTWARVSPSGIRDIAHQFMRLEWEYDWLSKKSSEKTFEEIQIIVERIIKLKTKKLPRKYHNPPLQDGSDTGQTWPESSKGASQDLERRTTDDGPDERLATSEIEDEIPLRERHLNSNSTTLVSSKKGVESTKGRKRTDLWSVDVSESTSDLKLENNTSATLANSMVNVKQPYDQGSTSAHDARTTTPSGPSNVQSATASRQHMQIAPNPKMTAGRYETGHKQLDNGEQEDTIIAYSRPANPTAMKQYSQGGDGVEVNKRARDHEEEEEGPRSAKRVHHDACTPSAPFEMITGGQQPMYQAIVNPTNDLRRGFQSLGPYQTNDPRLLGRRMTMNPPQLVQQNGTVHTGAVHTRGVSFAPSRVPVRGAPQMVHSEYVNTRVPSHDAVSNTWTVDMSNFSVLRDYYLMKARVLAAARRRENRSEMREEELRLAALNRILSTLEDCSNAGHRVVELR